MVVDGGLFVRVFFVLVILTLLYVVDAFLDGVSSKVLSLSVVFLLVGYFLRVGVWPVVLILLFYFFVEPILWLYFGVEVKGVGGVLSVFFNVLSISYFASGFFSYLVGRFLLRAR